VKSVDIFDVKEPVMLERSIVSIEAGSAHVLELHEMNRDSCFIKVYYVFFCHRRYYRC